MTLFSPSPSSFLPKSRLRVHVPPRAGWLIYRVEQTTIADSQTRKDKMCTTSVMARLGGLNDNELKELYQILEGRPDVEAELEDNNLSGM
jgi:hypothetical protein